MVLLLATVAMAGYAQAQNSEVPDELKIPVYETPKPSPAPRLEFWDIGRVFVSLLFVIGLMYGAFYLLRKGWQQRGEHGGSGSQMQVLGRLYLGPKKQLYLVELPERILVLGVTDHQISLLSQITDESEITAIRQHYTAAMAGIPGSFLQQLRQRMARGTSQEAETSITLRQLEQSLANPIKQSEQKS